MLKLKNKSVEKIHQEFDMAADNLIAEAKSILSRNEKSQRLKNLGFSNAEGVVDNTTYDLAIYYQNKYPLLKFITEDLLVSICKKYGLKYMPVENYIGSIPDKNISEIESAKRRDEDDSPEDKIWCELKRDNSFCFFSGNGEWPGIWGSDFYKIPRKIKGKHFHSQYSASDYIRENLGLTSEYLVKSVKNFTENRQGLFICAPPSQFKGKNKSITFFETKDPIVFRFVKGGVQIISKWGLEGKDKELVNEKMN